MENIEENTEMNENVESGDDEVQCEQTPSRNEIESSDVPKDTGNGVCLFKYLCRETLH